VASDEALLGCRLKLLRASECLDATFAEAESSVGSTCGGYPEYDPAERGAVLIVWREHRPLPPILGVMFGEAVHNIRTALDHLVWQAVRLNGEKPTGSNHFPIADTSGDWLAQIDAGRLAGVAEPVRAIIQAAQPYHRGNQSQARDHFLAVIREASNTDKHRTLPVQRHLMRAAKFETPRISGRGGVTAADFIVERLVAEDGVVRLENNTPLMRIRPKALSPDTHPTAEVGVESGPVPAYIAFEYRPGKIVNIGTMRKHLESVVALVDEVDDAL
jgi:hypothetical protein